MPWPFAITVWDPGIGVKVFIEQPWDFRANPFEEGDFDAWGNPSQCPKINQGSGSQEQRAFTSQKKLKTSA